MAATETPATGDLVAYGGASAPSNWLLCDGSAVSRATFSALFALIGTTFGAGDGSTTFNVPDMRQRFPRSTSGAVGSTGGAIDHTHTGPIHSHTITIDSEHAAHVTAGAHTHNNHTLVGRVALAGTSSRLTGPNPHNSQGGHTHDAHSAHSGQAAASVSPADTGSNNPPFQADNYIVHI